VNFKEIYIHAALTTSMVVVDVAVAVVLVPFVLAGVVVCDPIRGRISMSLEYALLSSWSIDPIRGR
jgi:hypothetical protein